VTRQGVAASAGDPCEGGFEARVLERLDLPTVVADEVVVMLAARERGLVTGDPVAEIDALDETRSVEPVERPVDARDSDAKALSADAVVDLLRGHTAALAAEELDDGSAGGAAPSASFTKPSESGVDPRLHADNDTRSQ
jgi:hypothetical protein